MARSARPVSLYARAIAEVEQPLRLISTPLTWNCTLPGFACHYYCIRSASDYIRVGPDIL